MRKDIQYYFERNVADVFAAYDKAIQVLFSLDPHVEPFHTISFGLSFSFTYNMNGGACTIRFMPYDRGTAVNLRYSIVQLYGARYTDHSYDMLDFVEKELGTRAYSIEIPVEVFLDPRNQYVMPAQQRPEYVYPEPQYQQPAPQPYPQYQPQPQPEPAPAPMPEPQQPQYRFCPQCGNPLDPNSNFCPQCGFKVR